MRKMKLIYLSAGQLVHRSVTKAEVKDQTSDSFWWRQYAEHFQIKT